MPSSSTDTYLTLISPRDRVWDTHKKNLELVINTYRSIDERKLVGRLCECSNRLLFNLVEDENQSFSLRLSSARFCRVRYCPVCQWRRQLMWRAKVISVLPSVLESHPTSRWLFLTLTARNCDVLELRKQVGEMNRAWSRLVKRKDFPAIGWIRTLEITRSLSGEAHPHFHCLLMVPSSYFGKNYMPQAVWSQLWKESLRVDYTPVVHIKAVRKHEAMEGNTQEALIVGICETLKYSVKEQDLIADPNWLGELTRQMHNMRAIAVGGVLKQFLSENEPEDLIDGDVSDEEVKQTAIKVAFDWDKRNRKYKQTELSATLS